MKWEAREYVYTTLPLGLQSAPGPIIFSTLADDVLTWMMKRKGTSFVDYYINDFITASEPGSKECLYNLQIMFELCSDTGTLVEQDKTDKPSKALVF